MAEGSLSSSVEFARSKVVPLGCGCFRVGHYSGSSVPNYTSVIVISFCVRSRFVTQRIVCFAFGPCNMLAEGLI
jgi:hypothetical protein